MMGMVAEQANDGRRDQGRNWAAAQLGAEVCLEPAAADASNRRYFRVRDGAGRTWILMDAPAQRQTVEAFLRVGRWLESAGVHVPQPQAVDEEAGLVLLTDLGQQTFLDAWLAGSPPEPLLESAVEALVRWQSASRPGVLPEFGAAALREELSLFTEWYLTAHRGLQPGVADPELESALERLAEGVGNQPRVFVHRDFMGRNLMVSDPLPGVLDFQDAVWGPVAYDPVCLLRDAFISWPPEVEERVFAHYWSRARAAGVPVHDDYQSFRSACSWAGVQRHLKVLGIFARLSYRDGKAEYLKDAPRFWRYLRCAAAEEPALSGIIGVVAERAGEAWVVA